MSLPNLVDPLDYFGIPKDEKGSVSTFDSKDIEKIGVMIAWELAKGKGRVIIDYDPAYPKAVKRTYTDTPNTPDECYEVTFNEGRCNLKRVPPTPLPPTPYITPKD